LLCKEDKSEIAYLDGSDESLGISLKLPFTLIQLVGAGCNNTARPNGGLGNITRIGYQPL
jgi:hypothetical protein